MHLLLETTRFVFLVPFVAVVLATSLCAVPALVVLLDEKLDRPTTGATVLHALTPLAVSRLSNPLVRVYPSLFICIAASSVMCQDKGLWLRVYSRVLSLSLLTRL